MENLSLNIPNPKTCRSSHSGPKSRHARNPALTQPSPQHNPLHGQRNANSSPTPTLPPQSLISGAVRCGEFLAALISNTHTRSPPELARRPSNADRCWPAHESVPERRSCGVEWKRSSRRWLATTNASARASERKQDRERESESALSLW